MSPTIRYKRLLLYVNCQALFSANPVTLTKDQRLKNWCILVFLMKVHTPTKFEKIRYHSLWKTANIKILDKFECTSIISPWNQNNPVELIYLNYFHLRLHPYKVFSWSGQWLWRYEIRPLICFSDPVTLSKCQGHQKMMHTCSVYRK